MRSHFKHEIQFVKHRNLFFTISLVLVVLSIAGLLFRGLNFGIEFLGGVGINFDESDIFVVIKVGFVFHVLKIAVSVEAIGELGCLRLVNAG